MSNSNSFIPAEQIIICHRSKICGTTISLVPFSVDQHFLKKTSGIPEYTRQLKKNKPNKIISALKKFAEFPAISELKEILEGV
jgi:hypothetical protein